jgi:hypothetical protein
MKKIHKLTTILLFSISLLSCKNLIKFNDQYETKEILIYHYPYNRMVKSPIKAIDINNRCSHVLKINPQKAKFFLKYYEIRELQDSLKFINELSIDSSFVRTKIIFSFYKSNLKIVFYLLEDKTVLWNNKRFESVEKLNDLLELN